MNARRAGLIGFVAVGLYVLFLNGIAHTATSPAPDFPNYYYSTISLAEGASLYADFSDRLPPATSSGQPEPAINYLADPPSVALLFFPVRWLSYEAAWWVLIGLSALAMVATVWLTGVEIEMSYPWLVSLAAASLLTTGFRFHTLRNHFETLLALLATLGWIRLRRGKNPGLYWGLAASLKLFPALWTVAALRNRRAVFGGLTTFLVVMLVALGVVGPGDFEAYIRDVIPRASRWYEATGNYSLMSVGSLLGGPTWGWGLTAVGLGGFAWTAFRLKNQPDALYVSSMAWSLLLSPLSWLNYLVLAVSPLVVAIPAIDWARRRHLYPGVLMVVGLVAMRPILGFDAPWLNMVLSRIPTISLLLLAVWAPMLILRRETIPA